MSGVSDTTQQEQQQDEEQQDEEEDSPPTKAVILLGEGIFFQPQSYDVLCLSIFEGSALAHCLQNTAAQDDSLEALHLVVPSNQVVEKFPPDSVAPLAGKLRPGDGEWTTHLVPLQPQQPDEELPCTGVPEEAQQRVRESLVLGGLRIRAEETGPDGSWTIVAHKPLLEKEEEEEDDDDHTKVEETAAAEEIPDKATDELAVALETKLQVTEEAKEEKEKAIPSERTRAAADWIRSAEQILVLTGAGVSVSAGIPDFRTPGTGLYDNLQKYNLPYAEAVFAIDYYTQVTPQPFVQLASDLWPSSSLGHGPQPTLTHCFVALLHHKQKLLRNYSQNIDGLEHRAGIPTERLVECHGHFRTASCTQCRRPADIEAVRHTIVVERTVPECWHCGSYVKPDIVFFGEALPPLFHQKLPGDLRQADLCLILGTSLQVPPVAYIPDHVKCSRRILVNRERVGSIGDDDDRSKEDVFLPGDCDESVLQLARVLGWEAELQELYAQFDNKSASNSTNIDVADHEENTESTAPREPSSNLVDLAAETKEATLSINESAQGVESKH